MPIKLTCQMCGKEYTKPPSRLKESRFCGRSCQMKNLHILAKQRTGSKHQNYVIKEIVKCSCCGTEFERYPKLIRINNYCSYTCRCKHLHTVINFNKKGKQHPAWNGGQGSYRGPNWQEQRMAALDRDNHICQFCANETNVVHHKKPFQLFVDYKIANDLENLISLCKHCHGKADKDFWENYTGERNTGPYKSPFIACKKCGMAFNGRNGAKSKTGILRYCKECRTKICAICGKEYDITGNTYKRSAKSRFCSPKCRDIGLRGVPKKRKYWRQLPEDLMEIINEIQL